MKGNKPLSDFIRTDGIYQSTAKLTGEMHAACFMYGTFWNYILFREKSDKLQFMTSSYDFKKLDDIKRKLKVKEIKLIDNPQMFKYEKENWENGTFTFEGVLNVVRPNQKYYGHFRTDYISEEQELLLIGSDNFTDLYKFVKIENNHRLEYELLNLFTRNKYITVNNGLPSFGQTDVEMLFTFEKLERNQYIKPSGTYHLDCFDYVRTESGDNYYQRLKRDLID